MSSAQLEVTGNVGSVKWIGSNDHILSVSVAVNREDSEGDDVTDWYTFNVVDAPESAEDVIGVGNLVVASGYFHLDLINKQIEYFEDNGKDVFFEGITLFTKRLPSVVVFSSNDDDDDDDRDRKNSKGKSKNSKGKSKNKNRRHRN